MVHTTMLMTWTYPDPPANRWVYFMYPQAETHKDGSTRSTR